MPRNRPLIYTAMNSAAFFLLGLVISQRSPSFNDLILISKTDVAGGSFFVTASNFGCLFGSLLAGLLYGRIKAKSLMIGVAMTMTGVFTALTPWCSVFAAMVVVHGLVSTCCTLYETIANTEEIQAWDGSSQAAMQFLSFCYSLGGVFGPLITEPFLARKETVLKNNNNTTNNNNDFSSGNDSMNTSLLPVETSYDSHNGSVKSTNQTHIICLQLVGNCTPSAEDYAFQEHTITHNVSTGNAALNDSLTTHGADFRLHYAYLITGATSIAVSLAFYVAFIKTRSSRQKQERREEKSGKVTRNLDRQTYLALMAMVCAFFYFHQMGIDALGQYRFYFVVTHLGWSKQNGAFLVSMYWAVAMCVKLALVAIYKRVKTGIVLCCSVSGIVTSTTLFSIAGLYHIDILVWISTASMAISQAAMFSGSFSWTDGNLIKLDGKETSALMISASLGAMSSPIPVAALMKHLSLMALPYFVLCQLSVSASLFLTMMFLVKPLMNKRFGPLRPPHPSSSDSRPKEDIHEAMVQDKCVDDDDDAIA